ncbi:mitochondrial import protein Pam17-domain-containing protein [Chaetomium sp. MPI-SDFR-AT-0129]|nr:mitochondrial import protein Pam17-domain-containing protein [Chaetomium sp. MPI-SDFR-AT-0129]
MIASKTTTMFRAGTLQPALLRTATCPYSAGLTTMSPFSMTTPVSKPQTHITRSLSTSTQRHQRPSPLLIQCRVATQTSRRHASTSRSAPSTSDAAADAGAAQAAAKAAAAAHPEQVILDWNTFFALRKARRRWQSGFSIVGALGSGSAGGLLLSSGLADSVVGQIPLDPFFTLGLMTMGCAALGWLVGPILGSAVFNATKSKYKGPMAIKESEFFARVKKHRVDPSASSVRNPVPDFYGEKISSVAGYRQWLRDQRAFNRKKGGLV